MLGQFFSEDDRKYNVVILAGGLGTRMGTASEHIPKALTRIGSQRAIDLIVSKCTLIADRFVIGTAWHADLLESYVRGRYGDLRIAFSRESVPELRNNATSLLYALDTVDSRLGTIVTFCDLILLSNPNIQGSAVYLATDKTKGVLGTFRHAAAARRGMLDKVIALPRPARVSATRSGVIGFFVFQDTVLLKSIVYSLARSKRLRDITTDVVSRYVAAPEPMKAIAVDALLEFGTDADLQKAREVWETY